MADCIVCRICRQPCVANSRLSDRNFLEKAQDIFTMVINVSKNHKCSAVTCDDCFDRINEYDNLKRDLREKESEYSHLGKRPISVSPLPPLSSTLIEYNGRNYSNPDKIIEPIQTKVPKKNRLKDGKPTRVLLRFTREQLAQKTKKELYGERRKTVCETCGKMIQDSRMENHKNYHKDIKPYACLEPDCKLAFRCKASRIAHVKRTHANGYHPCEKCGKVLASKLTLRTHLYLHKDKQFKCELCGMMSLNKSRLELHMRVHTQKRDFKCPHCPKSFYVNSVLTLHLRSHSGERPYVCHVCQSAYSHRILYVKHMRKNHPDENVYKLSDMPKIARRFNSGNR